MKILGIVLIVLGILMFIFGNVTFTRKEKVVDAGPVEINKKGKAHGCLAQLRRSCYCCGRRCYFVSRHQAKGLNELISTTVIYRLLKKEKPNCTVRRCAHNTMRVRPQ